MVEVVEAKKKEMQNLKDYDTFEEVIDRGQDRITSRWIITKKQKHDGQKCIYKARLVSCGFQEEIKPQSDALTISNLKKLTGMFMLSHPKI